jgi:hypothetical protein
MSLSLAPHEAKAQVPPQFTKLILLIETEPTQDELNSLYGATDNILLMNDYNSSRRAEDLMRVSDVLVVNLHKYLRQYEQTVSSIPADTMIVKYGVRGIKNDMASKSILRAHFLTKYLPIGQYKTLAAYLACLTDHMSSDALITSSWLNKMKLLI